MHAGAVHVSYVTSREPSEANIAFYRFGTLFFGVTHEVETGWLNPGKERTNDRYFTTYRALAVSYYGTTVLRQVIPFCIQDLFMDGIARLRCRQFFH